MTPITIPSLAAVRMTTSPAEPHNTHVYNAIAKNGWTNPGPVSVDPSGANTTGQPQVVQSAGDAGRAGYLGYAVDGSKGAGRPAGVLRNLVVDGYAGVTPGREVYIDQQAADFTNTLLAPPATPTLTPSTTGGTLPASTTNNYRVTALNAIGETLASTEPAAATTTGTTSSITISWAAVTGAVSYNVYGRATGAELFMANVPSGTLSFVDNGSITPAGALPASNTALAGTGGSGLTHTKPNTGTVVAPIGVGLSTTKIFFP